MNTTTDQHNQPHEQKGFNLKLPRSPTANPTNQPEIKQKDILAYVIALCLNCLQMPTYLFSSPRNG